MNMMQPKRKKGILVYIVFGAIIVVFALFFGYSPKNAGLGTSYAARVDEKIITISEFRNALEQTIEFYSKIFQGNFDSNAQRRMRIRSSTLEQLVNTEVIAISAEKAGWKVTPDELRKTILTIPAFQKDGVFHREYYDYYLKNYRYSAPQFESRLSRDSLTEKTKSTFQELFVPTDQIIQKELAAQNTKINLEFVKIDQEASATKSNISKNEIEDFLKTPESDKKLKEYYNLHMEKYSSPEQVKARHILIKTETLPEAEALKRITEIQTRLKTEDFAKVASEVSEDAGSKVKGGDLGFFSKGRMVPEFEKAAFSAEIGKVSPIVKTPFGFHLIKVEEKKEAIVTPLEKAKEEIVQTLVSQKKSEEALSTLKKALQDKNYAEVETLVKKLGFKWEETGLFSLVDERIPKMGEASAFLEAFSLNSENKYLNRILPISNYSYLIKFKEKQKPQATKDSELTTIKSQFAQTHMWDSYKMWIDENKKGMKIQRNSALEKDEMPQSGGAPSMPDFE